MKIQNKQSFTQKALAFAAVVGLAAAIPAQAIVVDFTQWGQVNGHNVTAALVYNGGGSWTVVNNAAETPYDGADDTFIGLLNNSSESISSVFISSTVNLAGGIFNFDGDGQAIYAGGVGGVYHDASGYAGPNVTFSGIAANYLSGTVNFTTAIGAGGKAWWTLEEAIGGASGGGISVGNVPDAASSMMLLSGALGCLGLLRRRIKG